MEIRLRDDDSGWETVEVTRRSDGLLQLEGSPVTLEFDPPLYLGDAIDAELLADGTYRLRRVVRNESLRHESWVVPAEFVASAEYRRLGDAVEAAGGQWEGAMGGLLWVHLPLASTFDASAELRRRLGSVQDSETQD